MEGLNRHKKSVNGSRILVIGVAYKKNVDDDRESPSYKLIRILRGKGAETDYYDPFIPVIRSTREYPELAGERSIQWNVKALCGYDAVLIATDHSDIDYHELVKSSQLVVDTRNATRAVNTGRKKIIKA